jgi:hypothetical protein
MTIALPALWSRKMNPSTKSRVTAPKIHTAANIMAMEDKAEVLLVAHYPDREDIMEIMEANPN